MRQAGLKAAELLAHLGEHVRPGISTLALEQRSKHWLAQHNLKSATLHYKGFPASICTSPNNVVCHGIPHKGVVLQKGDILNIDVTLIVNGYHGDVSKTFMVGTVPAEVFQLVNRTQMALTAGIHAVQPGQPFNVIGAAIEDFIRPFGYGIVTALCGHGIGRKFHEDPLIIHTRQKRKEPILKPGMTFTIEPMINMGSPHVFTSQTDGWTVYTKDGSLSAQFEHTVAVTPTGAEILTVLA